ncbi:hypothetical protein GCM10007304_34360 [Rhodococcoides trifolii]|uniref:Uncharacterized protein n=1 Tax=Rhodococcoides trifolii TaxID=908250 RepID=A0A917G181_9NOCA|nr:hypothetical protein [Rhodococcus trifolii]GGG17329.1 hypothetical protein GCM10007304_34360 [Rhodococcus trifolii]
MDIDLWRSRMPVTRASDGELVGWTVSLVSEEIVDAVNPVGHVVEAAVPVDAAIDVLEARGLSSLSAPYWAKAPLPIDAHTDLRRPRDDWRWRRMVMVQLDDTRVWIRPAYPDYTERMVELPLPLPADDLLLDEPPTTDE